MAKQNIDEVISEIKADIKNNNLVENVYSKLQKCRVLLSQMNLKKSGLNKHNKVPYYELKDFLPSVMILFAENRLISVFRDLKDYCELDIINADNPEEILKFTSTNTESKVPGATAIQSQGALLTYQRRYLYVSALEIVESDIFDSLNYGDKQPQPQPKYIGNDKIGEIQKKLLDAKATQEQMNWLFASALKVDSFDMILEYDIKKVDIAIDKIATANKEKKNG